MRLRSVEQALEKCPPKSCRPLFLMYAQLEEDHGLAKRSMAIYNRATQVVNDEDKFEVCGYLFGVSSTGLTSADVHSLHCKSNANFGLPAT